MSRHFIAGYTRIQVGFHETQDKQESRHARRHTVEIK